jgi:RHS repeat-associated protein
MQYPRDVEGRRKDLRPGYNRAGALEQVVLGGTVYVERIVHDAKGQRTMVAYGNGVMTRYAYELKTFRLARLRSERYSKPAELAYRPSGQPLQDFGYRYDLAGNILSITDRAPESGILNNPEAAEVSDAALALLIASGNAMVRKFEYDAIYRLVSASGRECDRPSKGPPWRDQPRCTDLTRTRGYTESYRYDQMGNILRLEHRPDGSGFVREFTVQSANNRLVKMKLGESNYPYTHDVNGNMVAESSSRHFEWNHSDEMMVFRTQTVGAEPSIHAHYLYDSRGRRVKKLVRKQGGSVEGTVYVDDMFEHHRWQSGGNSGENNHLHMMDDHKRIALVRVGSAHPNDRGPAVQLHLGDHLGSSAVVIEENGEFVNREEHTPYGETSFCSYEKNRYRFMGKERDEESGLNYHGARYYLPWVARWASCDPLGFRSHLLKSTASYDAFASNPIVYRDPDGKQPSKPPSTWEMIKNKVRMASYVILSVLGDDQRPLPNPDGDTMVDKYKEVEARSGLERTSKDKGGVRGSPPPPEPPVTPDPPTKVHVPPGRSPSLRTKKEGGFATIGGTSYIVLLLGSTYLLLDRVRAQGLLQTAKELGADAAVGYGLLKLARSAGGPAAIATMSISIRSDNQAHNEAIAKGEIINSLIYKEFPGVISKVNYCIDHEWFDFLCLGERYEIKDQQRYDDIYSKVEYLVDHPTEVEENNANAKQTPTGAGWRAPMHY